MSKLEAPLESTNSLSRLRSISHLRYCTRSSTASSLAACKRTSTTKRVQRSR